MTRTVKDKKAAILMAVFFSIFLSLINSAQAQSLEELDREISGIINRISGSVATVEARPQQDRAPIYPGQNNTMTRPVNAVVGSGLLIDSVGHILTSLGLVDGYDNFQVKIQGRKFDAILIGIDRRHSLAVLKVDTVFLSYIDASSFPPVAGRLALAYGHSFEQTGYPALGIVAGRQSDGNYLVSGSVLPGLLGGGIFDLSGQLMGVISSGSVAVNDYSGTWGGIVMLPASVAYAAAYRIINFGNRDAGYLGVRTTAIELVASDRRILGEAVAVSGVDAGSPAAAAGIREGDIITHIGFKPITNDRDLQSLIGGAGPDSTVKIDFLRGRQRFSVSVSLTSPAPLLKYIKASGPMISPDRQTLITIELQRRIDSMWVEMQRLQQQLERLIGSTGSAR